MYSDLFAVTSGVPQVTQLFLLYVNHVTADVSCNFKLFTGNLKLYVQIRHLTVSEPQRGLTNSQRDIDLIVSTAESWTLKMKANKCGVLRIQRGSLDWNFQGPHSS